MKAVLSISLFFLCAIAHAQDVVPLFNTKVETRYATLSPDGKTLVVAASGDSIVVKDANSFVTKRVVSAFTNTSPISMAYTGKKIFHVTDDNNLLYVTKKTGSATIDLVLRSEAIETGKINYEIALSNINKPDYESEKLYNRFAYGMNVSGNMLVYFLNENIFLIDIPTGKITGRLSENYVVSASLSGDQKLLAVVTPDSIRLLEHPSVKTLWRIPLESEGVHFFGDKLVSFGDNISALDVKSGKETGQLYYSPGKKYGIEESRDKKYFTFSNSYFHDHGFAATFDHDNFKFTSIFHLPKTEGYTSFFHPATGQHWLVTVRGQLYRFSYNDNPKPVSQAGHHNTIKSFAFSRDQRSLVTASDGGEIIIWDIPSSRVKERYNTNITWMEKVMFDDKDEDLFCTSNIASNKIHRSIPVNADALAHNIFFDPKDSEYVDDYLEHHKEEQHFYKPNIVVKEGVYNTIEFVDITSGKVLKRLGKPRNTYAPRVEQLVFNETGDTLASVSNQFVQLWDLRKGENILNLDLGKRASQNGAINLRKGKLTFITENSNNYFATVADVASGSVKMIIYADTSFRRKVDLVDLNVFKAKGYPTKLKLSPDGKTLLILRFSDINGTKETFIDSWDLLSMTLTKTFAAPGPEFPTWDVSWEHNKIAVWDFNGASQKQQKTQNDQRRDFGMTPLISYSSIRIIDMITGKSDEIGLDKININRVGETSVRIVNGSELWALDTYDNRLVRIDLKKKSLKGVFDLSSYGFYERIGNLFSLNGNSFIYAVHPFTDGYINQFRKWDIAGNTVTAQSNSNSTAITSFSEVHASGVFAIGLADNTISIRSTSDLKEKYHITQDDEGHYAFMTPEHYYKADRTSAAALQFSWRNKSFALQQFDTWFNRPDKVLAATGLSRPADIELLSKAFLKRTKASPNEDLNSVLTKTLPVVSISNIDAIPLQTTQDSIRIEVNIQAHSSVIKTLNATVNGVPVKKISPAKFLYIPLTAGKNKIAITIEDQEGITSMPDEVVVELSTKRERNLYLFTVAVSNYKNPELKLNYTVKDARDIANFFSHDTRFDKVIIDSLFDSNVTAENIQQIRRKLQKAKPDDMVIVFFAGHGLLDDNLDFRFAPWALDLSDPGKTGILYNDIEKLLDGIKPINKLLLIDACHSGSVDKTEVVEAAEKIIHERFGDNRAAVKQQTFEKIKHNVFTSGMIDRTSFEVMQDIFMASGSRTGAQVVVATAGDSYAIESDEWKNGFLTYAFLSGLKSGNADLNRDRSITVDEIISHLKQEVKRMSAGSQLPRLREENTENYFEIWRY